MHKNLNFIACITNKGLDQIWFTLETFLGFLHESVQFREQVTCDIGQVCNFQVAPDPFSWVEFRRITWELFQVDAFCGPRREIFLDDLSSVRRTAIPNDQEQTRGQPLQLFEKGNDFTAGDGMRVGLEKQPACWRNRPDGRKMIVGEICLQDWRTAARSVGSHHDRQQIEP